MKNRRIRRIAEVFCILLCACLFTGCQADETAQPAPDILVTEDAEQIDYLPEGSVLEIIEGAAHAALVEAPYHRNFQDRIVRFLIN